MLTRKSTNQQVNSESKYDREIESWAQRTTNLILGSPPPS